MCTRNKAIVASLLILLSLVTLCGVSGCRWTRWRSFTPIQAEEPILMFSKYQLVIFGYASGSHNVFLEPSFLEATSDTSNLDTIPVFVIDSFCVQGACLESDLCYALSDWYDNYIEIGNALPFEFKLMGASLVRRRDLWFADGHLVPGGFALRGVMSLQPTCTDSSVSMEVYSRLVDRISGQEVASEAKKIRFFIKDHKHLDVGS